MTKGYEFALQPCPLGFSDHTMPLIKTTETMGWKPLDHLYQSPPLT